MKHIDLLKDPVWVKDIKAGVVNATGVANYLLRTVTANELANALADYLIEDVLGNSFTPILITEEMFKQHIRIKGWKDIDGFTGTKETRGRDIK